MSDNIYPNEAAIFAEVKEALEDSRRYLTEFGSVEPSALVRRINTALTNLSRAKDERCYLWQLEGVNTARIREGKPALTMTQFSSGCWGDDA